MKIKKLALNGFRNYGWETAEFSGETNVICGENAQGKTNLLEAVCLLSTGKSFRTRFDRELLGFDYSSANILADIESHGRQQNISIDIISGKPKRILVNGVKKTASELCETLNVVGRRKLLDNAISQIKPQYAAYLSQFNKLYENKTRILKDWREKPSLLETLDEFSEGLCRTSAYLVRYRAAYTKRLNEAAAPVHRDFSSGTEELNIEYKTMSTVSDPLAGVKDIYYEILEHQERHRQNEIDSGQVLTGAHKDDLEFTVNGKNARSYASQGQTRTAALSVKLAEREILKAETGEYPVLLLDDVLSELDAKRQEFVLNRLGGGQTLITCCEDENISARTGGKVIFVSGGRIK